MVFVPRLYLEVLHTVSCGFSSIFQSSDRLDLQPQVGCDCGQDIQYAFVEPVRRILEGLDAVD